MDEGIKLLQRAGKQSAAKARVAEWLLHFEEARKAQVRQWLDIEERQRQARHSEEMAAFLSRIGNDFNRDTETWTC